MLRKMKTKIIDSLPVFPVTKAPRFNPETWRLRVEGLVQRPQSLSLQELKELPRRRVRDDFTCLEGWAVKGLTWGGVRVSDVLELASVKKTATCALFSSLNYDHGLMIERCMEPTTILAYELNDAPLSFEHGAPLRLILSGQECFESIKWVNSIRITHLYVEGSAERIALKRIVTVS